MSKVELPKVWEKSICYDCKHRNASEKICNNNIIMAKRGKRCRRYEQEETGE